jgi:hypothetical protein
MFHVTIQFSNESTAFMRNLFLSAAICSILAGCSVTSPIAREDESESGFEGAIVDGDKTVLSDDPTHSVRYRIFHKAATGFVPLTAIRHSAEKRATEFCSKDNKILKLLEEKSATIASGWPSWPRIEYIFVCLDKQLDHSPAQDDPSTRLRELKKLFDDGTITQDEFDDQKKKILQRF